MLFLLFVVVLLVLRFGGSERLVSFRESAQTFFRETMEKIDYQEALETLGRSVVELRDEDSPVSVFGRTLLGFEQEP